MFERHTTDLRPLASFGILIGLVTLLAGCQTPMASAPDAEPRSADGRDAWNDAVRQSPLVEPLQAKSPVRWALQDEDQKSPEVRTDLDDDDDDDDDERYRGSAGFGIGATFDPDAFLGVGHADFYIVDHLAIGPLLQIARDSDDKIIAPSFNVKGAFEILTDGPRIRPFGTAGIGFAYIEDDDIPFDDDDLGLLLNLGLGADVFIIENVSVGTAIYFNFLPDKVLDERYFTSWEILSVNFHF
ncbi:MAG: hypothetical protein RL885_22960 [Planctomycetota bacterium]